MPRVSVLMGAYNCADTLKRSIESIEAQTFTDWELIICDDGSTDDTVKVIEELKKEDSRIVLLKNEENRGLSYALNRCIEAAKGEYCARMDGDDICDCDRFEKQVNFLDSHSEYGFVSTSMKRFDENGFYDEPKDLPSYSPTKYNFIKGSPFCHAPVMIRLSAYKAVDGYRDIEKTRGVEDYDLWFRLYAKNIKGYILGDTLYSMFDGRGAAKRRTFKRRMNEAWVRVQGYKMLKLPASAYIYVLKPVILAFVPQWLYKIIR